MSESILAAAAAATNEAVRNEAATARPATPIDEAEVASLVETLPARAREGKEGNAGAASFIFAEWDPRDGRAAEIAGAARERLVAFGLSPIVESVRVGLREVPGRVVVDYADLAAAALREEAFRVRWVDEARLAWAKVGGEGADVRLVAGRSGGTLARFSTRALAVPVNDASPFRLDFLLRAREREVEVPGFWLRPVAEVVAWVEEAIRPVIWTVPALEAAWTAVGAGAVMFSYGLFEGGQLRQCAVIEFRRGDQALKLAIEDVRRLSAADLAARALEGPWETLDSAGPPALMDRAPPTEVAGNARDRAMGILRPGDRRDAFVYVAPPGPPRVHQGDHAPVPPPASAKSPEALPPAGASPGRYEEPSLAIPARADPTRMTPVQALTHVHEQRAASRKSAPAVVPKAKLPAGGRTRKGATSASEG